MITWGEMKTRGENLIRSFMVKKGEMGKDGEETRKR